MTILPHDRDLSIWQRAIARLRGLIDDFKNWCADGCPIRGDRTSLNGASPKFCVKGKRPCRTGSHNVDLCSYIDRTKEIGVVRSTAIREFALAYFMEAATEAGHRKARHGKLIGRVRSHRVRPASRKAI